MPRSNLVSDEHCEIFPGYIHVAPFESSSGRPVQSPSDNFSPPFTPTRLKHRATTLIQRYAGSHFREAQRTAWMIDVVTHIDKCVSVEAGQRGGMERKRRFGTGAVLRRGGDGGKERDRV